MADLNNIEQFLKKKEVAYKVIDLGENALTVDDVVSKGARREEVVKTLLVKTEKGFCALCLRGDDRIDFRKVRKVVGKSEMAKPEEVLEVVGVPIGAVCPIKIGVPIILDSKVNELSNINIGSGNLTKGLEMRLDGLLTVIENFKLADIRKSEN